MNHVRAVLRQDTADPVQVRHAKKVLKEYRETGTVTRKRTVSHTPSVALKMAAQVGIDLDETLKRLMKEANA
jgi:hypothetical protein